MSRAWAAALYRPGACVDPANARYSATRREFSMGAGRSGLAGIEHFATALRPTHGRSAVLGRNALKEPGDCYQARLE